MGAGPFAATLPSVGSHLSVLLRRDHVCAGSVAAVVDIDAAIGFVVAHGDAVERARLSWLRTGTQPSPEVLDSAEVGQTLGGGWPASWGDEVASVDATCFRLAELDDLGALAYAGVVHAASQALAAHLRPDGSWPSFLAAGWLSAAVLHRQQMFYESAQIKAVLAERLPQASAPTPPGSP